jgi:outer membrane biogenesis lipoprotein LolB
MNTMKNILRTVLTGFACLALAACRPPAPEPAPAPSKPDEQAMIDAFEAEQFEQEPPSIEW